MPVDAHRALARFPELGDELGCGRLAGARGAHERGQAAGGQIEADVGERVGLGGAVAERDVIERHRVRFRRIERERAFGSLGQVHDVLYALHAAHDLVERHGEREQVQEAGQEHHAHDHEEQVVGGRKGALQVQHAAQRQHEQDAAFHDGHEHAVGVALALGALLPELVVLGDGVGVLAVAFRVQTVGLHHGHAVDELHDGRIELGEQPVVRGHLLAGGRHGEQLHGNAQHHGDQHAQSHGHVQGEQVAEHDGGRAGGGDDVGDLVGEKLLDALDVLDDHLFESARGRLIEEPEVDLRDVPADLRTHLVQGVEGPDVRARARGDGERELAHDGHGGDDAVLERRARVGVPLDEEQQHLVHHDERHEGAQGAHHAEQRRQRQMKAVASCQVEQVGHAGAPLGGLLGFGAFLGAGVLFRVHGRTPFLDGVGALESDGAVTAWRRAALRRRGGGRPARPARRAGAGRGRTWQPRTPRRA